MRRANEVLVALVLVTSCIFGGSAAPGRLLVAVPELLSLPLIVLALVRISMNERARWGQALMIGILLALPLLQLMPLPPSVWTLLPGRAIVSNVYAAAEIAPPWSPISMTPEATRRFLFALLPAASVALGMAHLDESARGRLVRIALGLGIFSVLLGFAQLAGGSDSRLRFYATASRTDAVGFFANRNHYAAFLYMLIPLAVVSRLGTKPSWTANLLCALAVAMLFLGIMISGSRAGWGLCFVAVVASTGIVFQGTRALSAFRGKRPIILVSAAAVIVVVALALAASTLPSRLWSDSLADDLRWRIDATTLSAIAAYFPVGSGFGSFESVYPLFESPTDVIAATVNNAHDDWLEVVLEAGLPGVLLLLAGLVYLVHRTFWSSRRPGKSSPLVRMDRATLVMFWLCAAHSVVDYPLRTMATNVLLALAAGLRSRAAEPLALRKQVARAKTWPFLSRSFGVRRPGVAR